MKTKHLLLLFAALLPIGAWADVWQDPKTKVNYYYTPGESEASVASSPMVLGDITLLSAFTVDGNSYSVTSIRGEAFFECSGLTSITIPNSVTSIGAGAFIRCSGLTSVTIPNSVTSIKHSVFSECSGLTSVTIPNSVTSIEDFAFQSCRGLTSVTIPNSVTSIGDHAFYVCSGLTSVTIGNSVTSIGKEAFAICSSLTSVTYHSNPTCGYGIWEECSIKDIIIGEEVTSVEGIFDDLYRSSQSNLSSIIIESGNTVYDSRDNCNAVIETKTNKLVLGCKNTIIPNSVTSIEDYAFNNCEGLTSITIPNSVTTIGDFVFALCGGLTSVTIGNSVKSIGWSSFSDCSGLTSVIIPNSVTSIGESAFSGCSGLTSVTIGNSVKSIGYGAFWGCKGLKEVYSLIEEPFSIDATVFRYGDNGKVKFTDATLYVPKGTKEKYQTMNGWKEFGDNIVETEFAEETPGDLNGDGKVNVGDIMAIINIMADGGKDMKGDVNGDGAVNVGDIMAIINIMAGK